MALNDGGAGIVLAQPMERRDGRIVPGRGNRTPRDRRFTGAVRYPT
jgi:hypothetical protein